MKKTSPFHKAALVVEVLFVYARFRRRMEREDVRDVVAAVRRTRGRVRARQLEDPKKSRALARHLNRATDRTLSVLPTDSRCLIQSIVLCRLLAVRGIPSTIVIGARMESEFAAHAWVELDGWPVSPALEFWETRLTEL